MTEEVFYNRIKGGSCIVHLGGHCHMQTLFPADFYYIPQRGAMIMSQYEEKKEWSLLNLEEIPKNAVRMSVDKEKLDKVMSAYEELMRSEKKHGKKIFDYEKRHGKFPNNSFLTKLASKINLDKLEDEFHKACEEFLIPPKI